MRLTAIIPHFYRERERNLPVIVESLHTGTLVPDEVIIWNNEKAPVRVDGALVVQSPRNVGAQARFLAAMMARGDRVLFLDNDVCVNRKTVQNLYKWSTDKPDSVVTLEGRTRPYVGSPYGHWPKLYGRGLKESHEVFLSLGRGEMMTRSRMMHAISIFPFETTTVMDDLWFSACCEEKNIPIYVVPCIPGESDLVDLQMGGVGLCKDPQFNALRDKTVKEIMDDLKAEAETA